MKDFVLHLGEFSSIITFFLEKDVAFNAFDSSTPDCRDTRLN